MKGIVRGVIQALLKVANWAGTEDKPDTGETIYEAGEGDEGTKATEEVHSIWDYLTFTENSQAFHLVGVVGFEEWVDMEEIKRRIEEVYGIKYGNDRSLYPYIKTLADAGLFESTSAGGRRKWRKRDLLIKLGTKKERSSEEIRARKAERKKETG